MITKRRMATEANILAEANMVNILEILIVALIADKDVDVADVVAEAVVFAVSPPVSSLRLMPSLWSSDPF